jgi:cytochrome P450
MAVLIKHLDRINPRLTEEVDRAVVDILGDNPEWNSQIMYQQLLRIVAIVSGNIFLGPEHCRSEEWVYHSIMYTVDLFQAIGKLKQWQSWTRPIGQYFIPELKSVKEHRRKAREFLRPIIAERRAMMNRGDELPDDMLQWLMNKSADFGVADEEMSLMQLNLSLAAIHTTTLTSCLA